MDQSAGETASTIAAWWGAGVATLVLLWDIRKWFAERARLVVSARGDYMISVQGVGQQQGEFVLITVRNRGRLPSTLTNIVMLRFKTRWGRLRRRSDGAYIVIATGSEPIPHLLGPGEEWSGYFPQTPDIVEYAKTGLIEIGVSASHRDKPSRALVAFNKS